MAEELEKNEETLIFDKKMECPICDKKFTTKQVKTGKARFLGTDDDLRPRYSKIDTIKYDVCMCPYCGYASVMRDYENVTPKQRKLLMEKIGSKYKAEMAETTVYTYDIAIQRYKMALLTAMTKPAKLSEVSYLCLKLSWLYRGKIEEIEQEELTESQKTAIAHCQKNVDQYVKQAYQGFTEALLKEYPPICGMDEMTMNFLMAVLAKKSQDYDVSKKFAFMVVSSKNASSKMKDKARMLIDAIKEEQGESE